MAERPVICPFCRGNFLYEVKHDNPLLEELVRIKKPLLMLAGPGPGKTQALAYKTKHLIKKGGVPKDEIAIITFTNEAAISMRKKISSEGDEDTFPMIKPNNTSSHEPKE